MRYGATLAIGLAMACGGPGPDVDAGDPSDARAVDAWAVRDAGTDTPPLVRDAGLDAWDAGTDAAPADAASSDADDDANNIPFDAAGDPSLGTGTSFRVTLTITYPTLAPSRLPHTMSVMLFAAPRADGSLDLTPVFGVIGVGTSTRDSAGWPVRWRSRGFQTPDCIAMGEIDLPTHVLFVDDDGDGDADRLTGSGGGTVEYWLSDAATETFDVTVIVAGVAEIDPPALTLSSPWPDHVPTGGYDDVAFGATEALVLPTDAWLETTDGRRVALQPFGDFFEDRPTRALGWGVWPRLILPFDTTLTLHTSETVTDLDGHPLVTPPTLATLPIPSAVASEGFEAGSTAHVEGSAMLVDHYGALLPIHGARSAFIGATDSSDRGGGLVSVRASIPAGASTVHVAARFFSGGATSVWYMPNFTVRVYAMNGDEERPASVPTPTMHVPTGDATWPYASEIVDVVAPLPATATDEVLVVIGEQHGVCGLYPSPPSVGALIDDVRVE